MDLMRKLYKVKQTIIDSYSTGYLLSRINDDTRNLTGLLSHSFGLIIKDILYIMISLIMIFVFNLKLAVVTFLILPVYVIVFKYYSKKTRKESHVSFENYAVSTDFIEESISNTEIIKLFGREKTIELNLFKKLRNVLSSNCTVARTASANNSIASFITAILPIVIFGFGGLEIINGRLSLGTLIAFNSFSSYLIGPINRLINMNIQIQSSLASLERVSELLALPEDIQSKQVNISNIESIGFNNLSFCYFIKKPVLKNVTFDVKKGSKIGIIGSSGSGKTTLLKMITGLYQPSSGTISINDRDLNELEILSLRKNVAMVEQEPYIFKGTVIENIKFGNKHATFKQIEKASIDSNSHEFIRNLEHKFNTIISRTSLSVGQKQRIAIARALLRQPDILLLDEVTSNVDPISEKYIMDSIFNISDDITVFIVSHKLNTVKNCDYLYVINSGKIIERGNHQELSRSNGLYKKMTECMIN